MRRLAILLVLASSLTVVGGQRPASRRLQTAQEIAPSLRQVPSLWRASMWLEQVPSPEVPLQPSALGMGAWTCALPSWTATFPRLGTSSPSLCPAGLQLRSWLRGARLRRTGCPTTGVARSRRSPSSRARLLGSAGHYQIKIAELARTRKSTLLASAAMASLPFAGATPPRWDCACPRSLP